MPKLTGLPSIAVGDTDSVFDTQEFDLGQRAFDKDGNEYIFLKGAANVAAGSWVVYDENGDVVLLSDTNNKGFVAIAMAAIVANKYGWYQVRGKNSAAKVAEAVGDNAAIYTSATDGEVGATASGHTQVVGAITRGSTTGSGTVAVQIVYPRATI